MSIIIKNILLDGKKKDIYIEKNIIKEVNDKINVEAEFKIDGRNKAAVPSFFNAHNHAAMTLLRGYADDLELHDWLNNHIWPLEAKLDYKDIYVGTKLACLEMIKSGTTAFNDMYFFTQAVAKAAIESGIRAYCGPVFIDLFDENKREQEIKKHSKDLLAVKDLNHPRAVPVVNPHSVYSVSREGLEWNRDFAEKHNMMTHIHLSETDFENKECMRINKKRPVPYLEELGMLNKKLIAAHAIWFNDREIETLSKNNVTVVHNPTSNMKLAVGNVLMHDKMKKSGLNIALGTDGCASNNNLDMLESMKFASLLQKHHNNKQTALPAKEAFEMATLNGAKAFKLNAGLIEEGKIADLLLINLKNIHMVPMHNLISNLVYSANSSCVDTTICDGKILMQNRVVEGEDKIKEEAQKTAEDLISRK